MPQRPFGPPNNPDQFDDWEECVAWADDQPEIDDPEEFCGWAKDETEGNDASMTSDDDVQYRTHHQPEPDEITVREIDDGGEDGLMAVRMPIASTGDVRNEGDDPLTREELAGMAQQINDRDVGVFLAHGESFEISDARYGQTERLGNWQDAEVDDERAEDTDALLIADAVMPDPETLPAATGRYRETLAILKEQAKRDITLSSSIGWREDDDAPGGNDLMEASIVGIPADPRTNNHDATVAMARAAVDAGADPGAFVDAVRDAVMGASNTNGRQNRSDNTPARRHLSEQQAEVARRIVAAYRDVQGNGSVENFEAWLFNVAWDQFDDDEFHAAHTALQEWYRETSPLDEPITERFIPFLDGRNGEDTDRQNMTDDTDTESGHASDTDTDDEQSTEGERQEAPEWAERMLDLQEQTNETLQVVADAVRQEDDEDDNMDEDEDDEEDEEEQAADTSEEGDGDDGEQSVDEAEIAAQREALQTLRKGGFDVDDIDLPDADADGEQAADGEGATDRDADDDEDATKALLR